MFSQQIPNLLSLSRVVATPFLAWLVMTTRYEAAIWVCLSAGATDILDGWLARRMKCASLLGAYLDPLGDKVMLVALYLTFALKGIVPEWLAWIVFGKDLLIVLGAAFLYARTRRKEYPPGALGKLATVIQIAASLVLLAVQAQWIGNRAVAGFAVNVVALFTAIAAEDYFRLGFRLLREHAAGTARN